MTSVLKSAMKSSTQGPKYLDTRTFTLLKSRRHRGI